MSLTRAWLRHISGASGAALLVPVAILGSLALLALAGGFGQLGGLGQALAGPTAPRGVQPGASATAGHTGRSGGRARLLPVVSSGPTVLVASTSGAPGSIPAGGPSGPHPAPPPRSAAPVTQPPVASPTPPPTTSPPVAPPPGGASPPTLIDQVISLGTSVTSRLPGPVGQLATSVLNNVDNAVGNVPQRPPSPHSSVGLSQLGSTVNGLLPAVHLP